MIDDVIERLQFLKAAQELKTKQLTERVHILGLAIQKTLRFLREKQLAVACAAAASELRNNARFEDLEKRLKDAEKQLEEFTCSICYVRQRNVCLQPCSHGQFCAACVRDLYSRNDRPRCPICRTYIDCFVVVQT